MAVCPFAAWRPLSRSSPAITPTAVVVHSNAGTSNDLWYWWEHHPRGYSAHFQITIDGRIFQYVDTTHRAIANVAANDFGISIETANTPGYGSIPAFNEDRWRGPQLAALIRLLHWLVDTHQIPAAWAADGRHGIASHDAHPSWTTRGHQCPGTQRRAQLRDEIIPALTADTSTEDDDMTPNQARQLADTLDQGRKAALHSAGAHATAKEALSEAKKAALLAASAEATAKENAAKLDQILEAIQA